MKKLLTVVAAAAIVTMAGSAMAAGSANLSVTANIVATCSVSGGTLAFGALDPFTTPLVTANSSGVTVTCTNGTGYTLSTTGNRGFTGTPGVLTNGTSNINYTIAFDNGLTGTGTGLAVAVPITGTIASGSYSGATPGSYTDTIQINVTP